MSPRAAWRLETLGFEDVYEYVAGKADWSAAGLPVEGHAAHVPRVGDLARKDVPTCRLDEPILKVRERVEEAGWKTCLVTNDQKIVLGRLYQTELEKDSDAVAEDVMRPGPSTFRPNVSVEEMLAYMDRHDLETAPITTSEGRLIGMFLREQAN